MAGLLLQNPVGISFLNTFKQFGTKTSWFWTWGKSSIHLPPLNRGLHPARHPLLDPWLETGEAWASYSTLLPTTTTRPPPQGSATRPNAAAHSREVESFRRRGVKEEARRRRPGGGFRCRWQEVEHDDGWVAAGGSCRCLAESQSGLLQSLGGARGRPRLELKPRWRFF